MRSTLALVLLVGCSDDLIATSPGNRVSGTLRYRGDAHAGFAAPGFVVGAFVDFPPTYSGHGVAFVELDDPTVASAAFELRDLPAERFYILASLVDLVGELDPSGPLGGFPDACALTDGPPNVTVLADQPVDGVDLELFDAAGALDPCHQAASVCPDPGKAGLALQVRSDATVEDGDILAVALFAGQPGVGNPDDFHLALAAQLSFPYNAVFDSLEPGSYAVTLCFDKGGDDIFAGGCGDDDFAALYADGAHIEMAADTIVSLGIDLESEASDPVEVETAAEAGCP